MAMDTPVTIFVFAGRRPNMELQLKCVERILAENPNVEYHIWNMARNDADREYVCGLGGERVVVHREHSPSSQQTFSKIFNYYAREEFQDHIFMKVDDDVVFLETERFSAYLAAIKKHSDSVVSAMVVNNGASTSLQPALWNIFQSLGVPLLDIHKVNRFAAACHEHFFAHHDEILGQPIELVPTKDWLSINAIGFSAQVAKQFAALLGKVPHPRFIAGRYFPAPWGIADEGVSNCLPRIIMRGFTAVHLTFGPQGCTPEQEDAWRAAYAPIIDQYLAQAAVAGEYELPGLSPEIWAGEAECRTEETIVAGENDPCVGRLGRGPVLTGPRI